METTRPPGFPGNPPARMPRAPTPARSPPPRPLRCGEIAFRPTHDVGPHKQCMSGLNHAAYGLPVNASRPGSPQAHASLGSGWRPTLAGWDWIPTGFRTRFRRSHHGILSPLTGLSRHTRCCMKDLLRVGRFGPPFSSPQEPHCTRPVPAAVHRGLARRAPGRWPRGRFALNHPRENRLGACEQSAPDSTTSPSDAPGGARAADRSSAHLVQARWSRQWR